MYRYTLSLTSALVGVGGQRHASAALPPGKTRYPLYRKPQVRAGQVLKISQGPLIFSCLKSACICTHLSSWISVAYSSRIMGRLIKESGFRLK
jgi:hypothetical protein